MNSQHLSQHKVLWTGFSDMTLLTRLSLLITLINILDCPSASWAKPKGCSVSDPTGSNRGADLCLKYPPYGMNPYGNSFTKSFDHKGFYGPRITPIIRGIDLKPQKQDGYFTGVNAKNGVSVIHSSSGRKWKGKATPQKVQLSN